ncbi:hypothetical protein N7463_000878 [Penicillium fimorum]|uniref:Carboxylic ester hydrolase n=1 Tax=Penicillium fimorum TaxID=1882269 RepID=A0A9W9Y553_9EURO|nr:hypothetical protein N7463_000878 [Penicillium fimorum]
MTSILKTTFLGEIRGTTENGVSRYLGIKYANLKNRLADAKLIEERHGYVMKATQDGPTAVSPSFGCDIELSAIQHPLLKKELLQSDIDCLNLNITVPSGTTSLSKLPVFLFVHGGGLVIGANSWPQFDFTRFVNLSEEKNLPIVAVSINYRLGAFGFLTSDELRSAGYKANNGIRDQRIAMRWVQKHILDFGGDPENVTLAGMSAGGASVTYHLHSDEPLFKRAIVMSGTFFLIRALSYEAHEENYRKVLDMLGLTNLSPDARMKALLEVPGHDIVAKIPPSALTAPAIDGEMVLPDISFAEVENSYSDVPRGKAWCRDLMIGDSQTDGSSTLLLSIMPVLEPDMKTNCAKRFSDSIHSVLAAHPNEAERILEAYSIADGTPDDRALPSVLEFFNDVMFFAPVLAFARGWNGDAHVYYFNEGNPWEGPWKGHATHILDLAYLFQNFREFMTPQQQEVGFAFAEDIFKFCHGVLQAEDDKGLSARVYGSSNKGLVRSVVNQLHGGKSMRRDIVLNCVAGMSFDDLLKVFTVFNESQ